MKEKTTVLESRGYHEFQRIGRPDVWYDGRSKFNTEHSEFDTAMKERGRGSHVIMNQHDLVSIIEASEE